MKSSKGPGESESVTELLALWRKGDEEALERIMPLVYDELRALARKLMRGEREGHTLRPTALVHEAYQRLVKSEMTVEDRSHFLSIAARVMRRVLVEHARARRRDKRGGGALRVTLGEDVSALDRPLDSILDIDRALLELNAQDERKVRVVEMHYFAGMTIEEIALRLGVSKMTVLRDLRFARAWLRRQLGPPPD